MKKKLMLIGMLVLSMLLGSGGGKIYASNSTAAVSTESQSDQLTVAQYKEEVRKIISEIGEFEVIVSNMNPADLTTSIEIYKEIVPKLTPLYEKLGSLNAPASLSGAQSKLKEGADASLELIKLTSEMFEFISGPPSDISLLTNKMLEIQEQMNLLQTKALGMDEALVEIMFAN